MAVCEFRVLNVACVKPLYDNCSAKYCERLKVSKLKRLVFKFGDEIVI
jgi:hypothetical protein